MLLQDLRYAVRSLWHSKTFAAVAILCLGFGIGLNTTIFSIVDGILLSPYPYPEPDRIRVIREIKKTGDEEGLSYLDLRDVRASNDAFSSIAASTRRSMSLSDGSGEPERYVGSGVSWDLFPMLGTRPILGQGFAAEHDRVGGANVLLIGYDVWTRRYHADPAVIGRKVLLNSQPFQIIGVMPEGFAFPTQDRLWVPLTPLVSKNARGNRDLFTLGRLKPDVTPVRATASLDAVFGRVARESPATHEGWSSRLLTLREAFVPSDVTRVIGIMMASVTLVLIIACSNVASLLVARAATRRREISVRAALGAGRGRIVRQLLTESVVLGLASLPLGLLLAEAGTKLIAAALPPDQVPYYIQWRIDARSLAYSVAVAVVTAIAFGLLPALQASRGDLQEALKEGTRGNTVGRSFVRSALVVVQVALALVSLVGALLFVRTFRNLDTQTVGFDTRPLLSFRFFMTGEPYEPTDSRLRRARDVVERIEALPGVQGAFASAFVPLSGGGGGGPVEVAGQPARLDDQRYISLLAVTPHFLQTMGQGLVRGRDFTTAEAWSHSPVAVVNQMMARRFWNGADPIGSRFRLTGDAPSDWYTVIGLVDDMRLYGVDPGDPTPPAAAFVPFAYQQERNTGVTIRASGPPAAITSSVRDALRASDPNLPMFQLRTVEESRQLNFWEFGLYGWIFGTIGVVGVLLASVGVYGVLSHSVAQRTQEIGVRVALGATRRDIFRLVIGQGLALCGMGVLIGLALAPAGTWSSRTFFYNVSPFDPLSFVLVAALFIAVAFLASYLPARRATRVDPVTALRGE